MIYHKILSILIPESTRIHRTMTKQEGKPLKTEYCPTLTGYFSEMETYPRADFGWLLAPIVDYLEPKRQCVTHQNKWEMAHPVKVVKIT